MKNFLQKKLLVQHALMAAGAFSLSSFIFILLFSLKFFQGFDMYSGYPYYIHVIGFLVGVIGTSMLCFILQKKRKDYAIPVLAGAFGFAAVSFFFVLVFMDRYDLPNIFLTMLAGYFGSYTLGMAFEERKRSVVIGTFGAFGFGLGNFITKFIYQFLHEPASMVVESFGTFDQSNIWSLRMLPLAFCGGLALGVIFSYYAQKDRVSA